MNTGGTDIPLFANGDHPDWSLDGSRIVFESIRDGKYEIYLMNADGTEQAPHSIMQIPMVPRSGPRTVKRSEIMEITRC